MSGSGRPASVTLVAIITYANGLFQIISGIIQLLRGPTGPASLTVGWVGIALGALILLVGIGLFRGSNVARILTSIAFAISVIVTIGALATGQVSGETWYLVIPGVLALIGLIVLWMPSSRAYFRKA